MDNIRDLIQHINEADPFPSADPDNVAKRENTETARRKKLALERGIIAVDPQADQLDGDRWMKIQELRERLAQLRTKYKVDDECICNVDDIEAVGEDMEYASAMPSEYGDQESTWCLRCGGFVDHG